MILRSLILLSSMAVLISLRASGVPLEAEEIGPSMLLSSPQLQRDGRLEADAQKLALDAASPRTLFSEAANIMFTQAMATLARKDVNLHEFNEAIERLKSASDKGHPSAAMEAARALFFGQDRVEPNFDRAASFLDSERCVDPECQFLLGLLYNNGLGGKNHSRPHALAYYALAARQLNPAGSIALGYIYGEGRSVVKNCTVAVGYYYPPVAQMSRNLKDERIVASPKLPRLSVMKNGAEKTRDIIEFYQFNSDAGDPSSMAFLGQVFYLGIGGVKRDLHLARKYFEQASETGNIGALAFLGQMDYYGEAREGPDYRSAYHRFRRASKESHPVGLNGMGLLYWRGTEVVADKEEAIKYFTKAADLGHAEAAYNLAKLYQEIDPFQYRDIIFTRYLDAMREGSVLAGYELATLNMEDESNCLVSIRLLCSVLDKHPSVALIEDGVDHYHAGRHSQAIARFLYMAEQGYEVAQHNLAFVLHSLATKQNDESLYRRALVWWTASAKLGHADSMVVSGDYFYYGRGMKSPLPTTAAAYYYAAFKKKSPQAAFNMGYLHQRGLGVHRDYVMAERYYHYAISYGQSEGLPEAWLPATVALNFVRVLARISRVRDWFKLTSTWFLPLAMAIIVSVVAVLVSILYFGFGPAGVSSFPGAIYRARVSEPSGQTNDGNDEHASADDAHDSRHLLDVPTDSDD